MTHPRAFPTATYESDETFFGWAEPRIKIHDDELFKSVYDKYNTVTVSLQNPYAFHTDVRDASRRAKSNEEFHAIMSETAEKRRKELTEALHGLCMDSTCAGLKTFNIIGPHGEGFHALFNLLSDKSLDNLVMFVGRFYEQFTRRIDWERIPMWTYEEDLPKIRERAAQEKAAEGTPAPEECEVISEDEAAQEHDNLADFFGYDDTQLPGNHVPIIGEEPGYDLGFIDDWPTRDFPKSTVEEVPDEAIMAAPGDEAQDARYPYDDDDDDLPDTQSQGGGYQDCEEATERATPHSSSPVEAHCEDNNPGAGAAMLSQSMVSQTASTLSAATPPPDSPLADPEGKKDVAGADTRYQDMKSKGGAKDTENTEKAKNTDVLPQSPPTSEYYQDSGGRDGIDSAGAAVSENRGAKKRRLQVYLEEENELPQKRARGGEDQLRSSDLGSENQRDTNNTLR